MADAYSDQGADMVIMARRLEKLEELAKNMRRKVSNVCLFVVMLLMLKA